MKRRALKLLLSFFLIALTFNGIAQDFVVIGKVDVVGNKKTRRFVINREMTIHSGDTIPIEEFQQVLLLNEGRLLNTRLFLTASVTVNDWKVGDPVADVLVEVQESWYFFPLPVLKLADRNFNVWWQDYDHDLSRVIWGIRLHHYNLTGVRDYLKVIAEFGFSQKYQVRYQYPYLNKSRTLGIEVEAAYDDSRNGAYATVDDRLEFLISEQRGNFRAFNSSVILKYRQRHFIQHEIGLSFVSNFISDTVRMLNPEYHINNNPTQRYFTLHYKFENDRRNRTKQATSGYAIQADIRQVGLGFFNDLNYGYAQLSVKNYVPIHSKITLRSATKGRWFFNKTRISYNHSQALGYGGDYIRGYEHYVIDGTDFLYAHQGFVWEFLNHNLDFSTFLPLKKMNVIPIRMFLSANFDFGYVNNPEYVEDNTLDTRWLYGYGPALEILVAESYLFGLNYSVNHLGETGIYLHTKFNF